MLCDVPSRICTGMTSRQMKGIVVDHRSTQRLDGSERPTPWLRGSLLYHYRPTIATLGDSTELTSALGECDDNVGAAR
jgi:hypothetical protein